LVDFELVQELHADARGVVLDRLVGFAFAQFGQFPVHYTAYVSFGVETAFPVER
jgi:hypothetical protein